ncbi:hypothetical protein [Paraburkholderia sp. J94]|uniref:hypothetical protein n=1 Tax=Paraburkholderia sp. J94 TaxID=2805441 RepID=UPI002AB2B4D5|nr:hypothetical protein [Paraburkholderia sp. J94]
MAQRRQVVGQRSQRVAGEVEHLQRIGEVEDLAREFGQPASELELSCASQPAGAQLFEGGGRHAWIESENGRESRARVQAASTLPILAVTISEGGEGGDDAISRRSNTVSASRNDNGAA